MVDPLKALEFLNETLAFRNNGDEVTLDGYTLNVPRDTLTIDGKTDRLRPIQTKILEHVMVMQGKGIPATKRDIALKVYQNSLSETNLAPHLTWLRQKLSGFTATIPKGERRAQYTLVSK